MVICHVCGEDIDDKGQDNLSPFPYFPICEDCYCDLSQEEYEEIEQRVKEGLYDE